MKRSAVYIVYSNLLLGGIPTKIIDIANAFRSSKTTVYIVLQKGAPQDLRSSITNKHVHIIDSPSQNPVIFMFWIWMRLLSDRPSSVLAFVSSYALPVLLIKTLFLHAMRVVVSEDHYTQTMLQSMRFPALQRIGIQYLYPKADSIIVPTHEIKQQLQSFFARPLSQITVIRNWTRFSAPVKPLKQTIDIVHIGRLVPSKNPMRIVQCMHAYCTKYNRHARCMLIGDGSEYTRLDRYIAKHHIQKNIKLHHAVVDVASYLRRSKVLLFMPDEKTEGFPLIILEAMRCGAVVMTNAFAGVYETIHDGVNGCIVKRTSVFPSAIDCILNNGTMRHMITEHAQRTIAQFHSVKNISEYMKVIL